MYLDPLYGPLNFSPELELLIATPVIQRLRHVRLSNIDSIDLPSIANISRFEHVLGVARLAEVSGIQSRISAYNSLVLRSSALLHDWAITSFGHLVEEALQYAGVGFDHERRLFQILSGEDVEVLGADLQIMHGKQTGLAQWARNAAGNDGSQLLRDIMNHIQGKGEYGSVIAGDIDIDNIDNIFRMQFHLGLLSDRSVPDRLARGIVGAANGRIIFRRDLKQDIDLWVEGRAQVYEHLMLSPRDFVGKVMLLSAAVEAFEANVINRDDWRLTDVEFTSRLLRCGHQSIVQAVERWMLGELWDSTPLMWVAGNRPSYAQLRALSNELSSSLGRECFVYGIKDKRSRELKIEFDDSTHYAVGSNSGMWLFGAASSARRPFKRTEVEVAIQTLQARFGAAVIGPAVKADVSLF